MMMENSKSLLGKIAVVAGATRGARRGIACMLLLRMHAKRSDRVQLPARAPLFYYVKPRQADGEIEIPDGFVVMDYRP